MSYLTNQINANLQLSDNDDVNNSEKVEVQCISDSDEYQNENVQLVSDDLRPKEEIKSRKVHEKEHNNDDPGRKFNVIRYNRIMANGENVIRNWLLYSKSLNRVFCLYCRLFPSKSTSSLASIGFLNWKQISERLKEHVLSIPHNKAQEKWIQLRMGLDLHKTVDNNIQDNLNIQKERWRSILKRIIACIEFLAEHNDAFRGPRIQNELISIIATKIRDEIINRVKQSKYFTTLLGGTPDKSHKEQLTFLLRIVEISKNFKYEINEYFICFIHISNKSGSNLTEEIKEQLQLINLDLKNCRGQAYDNGANRVVQNREYNLELFQRTQELFFCTMHCAQS
ncbi:PREDICTED: uncharacterized protein LOC107171436 [Diuraphis noxia]|uniref:uncharacterized protein LOC107171436 n=1 Tax=Diuraphis noxia TaxID=143948 RepID=UPI00076379F1|nr:PREDICTED: uncharacterized protein LOC107171436 [Diuraphis noxia]